MTESTEVLFPHHLVKHYCSQRDEAGRHGSHFIVYNVGMKKPFCGKCEANGVDSKPSDRCEGKCGECSVCEPCQKNFKWVKDGEINEPTSEELKSAIPYSTDVLDLLK